ncbi:Fc.00g013130.m01.CDS01 [Cosmosporella sp. VM-42]
MPRNKKGFINPRGPKSGRGGRGRGGTRGRGRHVAGSSFLPHVEDSAGFTLADEARQTSQHDHAFSSNLRTKPVTFVSAGSIEPLKVLENPPEDAEKTPPEPMPELELELEPELAIAESPEVDQTQYPPTFDEYRANDDGDDEDEVVGPEEMEAAIQPKVVPAEEPTFFFDLTGDQSQRKTQKTTIQIPDRPSSRDSSSSDEVILFKGRDAQRRTNPTTTMNLVQMQAEIQVVEQKISVIPDPAPVLTTGKTAAPKNKRQPHKTVNSTSNDEDDAIIADYIANMRENGESHDFLEQQSCNRRDLGGTESDHADSSNSDDDNDQLNTDVDKEREAEAGGNEQEESESDLDDETLAKLIAGQELGANDVDFDESSSDSDSSSAKEKVDSQLVDQDDFDLMDWYRPSLRRRKGKGARAQINFNVSDSELEQTLQVAWKNDRLNKSERKRQREELRALGMLGKKANPKDLGVKYPNGMDMEQVAEELRNFLLSSDETLALPPMDNHARKMIHDLSNKFKIKSKSIGKADQRRPVLHRTLRTLPFVESTFDQAINRVSRRYLPRLDIKGKRAQRPPTVRSNNAAAGYREGEIVGAAAPEIGIDNRGRNMLEKMGWSSGTALGATNNKGILQPVTHAMKNSKAGLG